MALSVIPDLGYRLMRLRRLLGLQAGIQGAGLILALTLGNPAHAVGLGITVAIAVLCVSWLSLRFPHGWMETLGLSSVLAALWATSPGWFSQGVDPSVVIGMVLTGFFAWLSVTWLTGTINFGKTRRERRYDHETFFAHPVDVVRKALDLSPGDQDETRTVGDTDENGLTPVHYSLVKGEHSDIDPNTLETPCASTAYVKTLEETADSITTITSHEVEPGVHATAVTRYGFREDAGGTWVRVEEVTDGMCWLSALGFWAQDFHQDYMTHIADQLDGLPARALKVQPMDTPITVLAKMLDTEVPQNPPH